MSMNGGGGAGVKIGVGITVNYYFVQQLFFVWFEYNLLFSDALAS